MPTLVFDTETCGKADFKSDDPFKQPNVVQLAAVLYDEKWQVRDSMNYIIKPDGWAIPDEVVKIHGISTDIAKRFGLPEIVALGCFDHMNQMANIVVAHNIKFDRLILDSAFKRNKHILNIKNTYCTMEALTPICKLPKGYGPRDEYKWPKLEEAYQFAFNEPHIGAHDAMADVKATARLYKWLKAGMTLDEPLVPVGNLPSESKQADGQANRYEPSYSDDDLITFGKYKGTRLEEVPADYLAWLFHENCQSVKLYNYIWNFRAAINSDLTARGEPIKKYRK